ncbi:MAG TPA: cupin domain-containing protein [Chloroflexota bacterium]
MYSPRHRHNFEQVRFILDGAWEYARRRYNGGWLGFFPEGAFYGPARSVEPGHHFVIQYAGPSNSPFISCAEERAAQREMVEGGAVFSDGICIWPDGRKQDGGEALWEFWAGRPIQYPRPRIGDPVWFDTSAYEWRDSPIDGVATKVLASLGDEGTAISLIRLAPGAATPPDESRGTCVRFVCDGEIEYGGRAYAAPSSLYYPANSPHQGLYSRDGAMLLNLRVRDSG